MVGSHVVLLLGLIMLATEVTVTSGGAIVSGSCSVQLLVIIF